MPWFHSEICSTALPTCMPNSSVYSPPFQRVSVPRSSVATTAPPPSELCDSALTSLPASRSFQSNQLSKGLKLAISSWTTEGQCTQRNKPTAWETLLEIENCHSHDSIRSRERKKFRNKTHYKLDVKPELWNAQLIPLCFLENPKHPSFHALKRALEFKGSACCLVGELLRAGGTRESRWGRSRVQMETANSLLSITLSLPSPMAFETQGCVKINLH